MSLEAIPLKACPECGQALKLHYRFCIRCGLECPDLPVCCEADPAEAGISPASQPAAILPPPPTPEPAP